MARPGPPAAGASVAAASTLARYLFAAYLLLVVYASLHPFSGWRDPGLTPLVFLAAAVPRYVTAFDIAANFLGYAPLGFLAVLALYPRVPRWAAFVLASAGGCALSLFLESVQLYLPSRIASNVDLASNAAGAVAGALAGTRLTRSLLREGRLQLLRGRLFLEGARIDLGLVFLGLWLLSQLNPETLLFGSGDLRVLFQGPTGRQYPAEVFLRVEAGVAACNVLSAALFLSCLVAPGQPARMLMAGFVALALVVRTLAYGVLFHPHDLFLWLTPGALFGLASGMVAALLAAGLPRALQVALAAVALMAGTALVNLAPENPYFAASLSLWRQGHFFNFNGLTRVVSAAWPFAALVYLIMLAGSRPGRSA